MATQESIFRRTRASYLIEQVLSGFHSTIFVYGQTGSGKTFTMEGYKYLKTQKFGTIFPQINQHTGTDKPDNDPKTEESLAQEGMIPRAIRELFKQIE